MIEAAEREGLLKPGRHDRGADVRQHRPRPRDRGGDPRLQVHLRDARQDEPGEGRPAARLRRRGRDLPDGRRAGVPGELLPRGRPARRGDPGRVPAEPVLQPREPPDALRHDRPGDLGADRRDDRRLRGRRRHRRHDHRRRALPEGAEPRRHGGRAPTRRAASTPATSRARTWSRASARTSGPPRSTRRVVDRYVRVSDRDSFRTARAITRQEGILVGGSGGTAVHAALAGRARAGRCRRTIVVLLPDTGRNYLSKLYSDSWMLQYGLLERPDVVRVEEVLAAKAGELPPLITVERARQGAPGGRAPAGARDLAGAGRPRGRDRRDAASSGRSASASCSTGSSATPTRSRPTSPR